MDPMGSGREAYTQERRLPVAAPIDAALPTIMTPSLMIPTRPAVDPSSTVSRPKDTR